MKTVSELKNAFTDYAATNFGGGAIKTAWHFVTWRIDHSTSSTLSYAERAELRKMTLDKFKAWAKANKKVASWENCVEWTVKEGVFKDHEDEEE